MSLSQTPGTSIKPLCQWTQLLRSRHLASTNSLCTYTHFPIPSLSWWIGEYPKVQTNSEIASISPLTLSDKAFTHSTCKFLSDSSKEETAVFLQAQGFPPHPVFQTGFIIFMGEAPCFSKEITVRLLAIAKRYCHALRSQWRCYVQNRSSESKGLAVLSLERYLLNTSDVLEEWRGMTGQDGSAINQRQQGEGEKVKGWKKGF